MGVSRPEVFLFDDERPLKCRSRKWLRVLAIVACAWLLGQSISQPRRFTCAACRAERVVYGFLGFRWSSFEESECSRWYAANVEPTHAHIWARHTYCRRIGIPGIYSGWGCTIGPPITGLSKTAQVRVYQKFRDPMEARRLFVRLGERTSGSHRLMERLLEWADGGGPETWDEWRETHHEE